MIFSRKYRQDKLSEVRNLSLKMGRKNLKIRLEKYAKRTFELKANPNWKFPSPSQLPKSILLLEHNTRNDRE